MIVPEVTPAMKTSSSLLIEPDVIPFYRTEAVVRLYKRQIWYAGFCWKIRFGEKSIRLWVDPYVKFGLGHQAIPGYPDTCLFSEKDWVLPDSLRTNERPFELAHCVPVHTEHQDPRVLICSFTDGTLIISQRYDDMRMAHDQFHIHPIDVFDRHTR